jgi:hypothetical protein
MGIHSVLSGERCPMVRPTRLDSACKTKKGQPIGLSFLEAVEKGQGHFSRKLRPAAAHSLCACSAQLARLQREVFSPTHMSPEKMI